MNFFSHAFRFVDAHPFFVVGTSIPDWLGMVDRRARVRRELAAAFVDDSREPIREIARGIVQHHDDDLWFHQTQAFSRLHVAFTRQISDLLQGDARFRPYFAAHIAIEMLIDSELCLIDRGKLDRYYGLIAQIDPQIIESSVNEMAVRPTNRLAKSLPRFLSSQFLYDYVRDDGVAYRVNRILREVGLSELPLEFESWVGRARKEVSAALADLLRAPASQPVFDGVAARRGELSRTASASTLASQPD